MKKKRRARPIDQRIAKLERAIERLQHLADELMILRAQNGRPASLAMMPLATQRFRPQVLN